MRAIEVEKLAVQFMRNAVAVRAGDKVWIKSQGPKTLALAKACAGQVVAAGGVPHLVDGGSKALNRLLHSTDDATLAAYGLQQLEVMQSMAGYIRICDDADDALVRTSRPTALPQCNSYNDKAPRVGNTRWLVVTAPTKAFAKICGMPLREFERFYLDVCLLDYSYMTEAAKPLEKLLREGRDVCIIGDETDLSFSIARSGAASATGRRNLRQCYPPQSKRQ